MRPFLTIPVRSFAAGLLPALLSGCMLPGYHAAGTTDPPWLAPESRPLNTIPPVQAGRPESPSNETRLRVPTGAPDPGGSAESAPQNRAPDPRDLPGVNDLPPRPDPDPENRRDFPSLEREIPGSRPAEPSFSDSPQKKEDEKPAKPNETPQNGPALPELRAPSDLELSVRAPSVSTIGEEIVFEIELRNAGKSAHDAVRIECEFDESLVFQQKTEKRVARTFDRLEAGGVKSFRLSLTSTDAGRHCCRFSVRESGEETAWKSVCVDVSERSVSLKATGPGRRNVGARAEFTFQAVNLTEKPMTGLRLTIRSEAALRRFDWSADAVEKPSELEWNLGTLQPGEGAQVQVEYDCLVASEESCVTTTLWAGKTDLRSISSCLTIAPADDQLQIDLSDARDPIRVSERTEFTLTVKNVGLEPVRDLAIELDFPAQWEPEAAKAAIDRRGATIQSTRKETRLKIELVQPLPVDGTLTIVVPAKATSNGEGNVTAAVTATGTERREIEEPTTVNP